MAVSASLPAYLSEKLDAGTEYGTRKANGEKSDIAMNWGQKIAADAITKIVSGPYDVTGVLAFKDGERMCHATAIKLFDALWHKADRVFFGKAADKGYGINRLCFLEFGKSGKCIHMHFVAQSMIDPKAFSAILNVLWNSLHDDTAGFKGNWITPIHDKQATAEYVTKEMWRFREDANVTNCDHRNTDIAAYASFDEEARIQRIANHVSAELLEMALNKIPVQMILIRQRMEQRQKETAARDRDRRARMAPSTASLRQHLSQNI